MTLHWKRVETQDWLEHLRFLLFSYSSEISYDDLLLDFFKNHAEFVKEHAFVKDNWGMKELVLNQLIKHSYTKSFHWYVKNVPNNVWGSVSEPLALCIVTQNIDMFCTLDERYGLSTFFFVVLRGFILNMSHFKWALAVKKIPIKNTPETWRTLELVSDQQDQLFQNSLELRLEILRKYISDPHNTRKELRSQVFSETKLQEMNERDSAAVYNLAIFINDGLLRIK